MLISSMDVGSRLNQAMAGANIHSSRVLVQMDHSTNSPDVVMMDSIPSLGVLLVIVPFSRNLAMLDRSISSSSCQ